MNTQTISPILEQAIAAAAARDRAADKARAERRAAKLTELRDRAKMLLKYLLDDDPDNEIDDLTVDFVDRAVVSWQVDRRRNGAPRGLVGTLDGIPLGLLPNPERDYETVLVAARYVDVDGVQLLAFSSPIHRLADLPDALDELEDVAAVEADAIRRQHAEDDSPDAAPVPEPDVQTELEVAIRRMDTFGLLRVADLDLGVAARNVAPLVIAAHLERIADHLDDRS